MNKINTAALLRYKTYRSLCQEQSEIDKLIHDATLYHMSIPNSGFIECTPTLKPTRTRIQRKSKH